VSGEARAHEAERGPDAPAKSESAPSHGTHSALPAAVPPPPPSSADAVLGLQRIVGNRATTQALRRDPGSAGGLVDNGGTPLAPALRDEMEERFGYGFRAVRIHTGTEAEAAARAVDAAAYTIGSHIVFGRAAYAPTTRFGRTVIAHELAHVIQQGRGGSPPADAPGTGLERAASASADAVVGGSGSVQVAGASGTGLSRMTIEEARKMLAAPLPEWIKRPARDFLREHQALVDYVAPPTMELPKPVEQLVEKARAVEEVAFGPAAPASNAPAPAKPSAPTTTAVPPPSTPAQKFDESVKKALNGDAQLSDEADSGIWVEDPALLEAIASTPDGEQLLDDMLREREEKRLAPLRHPVDPDAFKGIAYPNDPDLSHEGLKEGKPFKSGFYWIFPVIKQDSQTVVRYKLFNPQAKRVEWVVGQEQMKALWNDVPAVLGGGTVEEQMYENAQTIYGNKQELPMYMVSASKGQVWKSNVEAYQDPRFYEQTLQNAAQLTAAGTKPPPFGRALARAGRRGARWVRGAAAATVIGTEEGAGLGGGAATATAESAPSGQVAGGNTAPPKPAANASPKLTFSEAPADVGDAAFKNRLRRTVEGQMRANRRNTIGAGGEASARGSATSTTADLNDIQRNAPQLDIVSPRGAGSVKAFGVGKPLTQGVIDRYLKEMEALRTPVEPGVPTKLGKIADIMAENRNAIQAKGAWPNGLSKNASPGEIARFINRQGELVIPSDHVPQVQDALEAAARQNPAAFGLTPGPGLDTGIARLRGRVQSMGMSSQELNTMNTRVWSE
jgi:hypothetical protein